MLFTVGHLGLDRDARRRRFPIYLGAFVPLTPATSKLAGVVAIVVFTAINIIGVKQRRARAEHPDGAEGRRPRRHDRWSSFSPARLPTAPAVGARAGRGPVRPRRSASRSSRCSGRTRDGTTSVFAAGEIRDPQRNFPRGSSRGRGDRDRAVPRGEPRVPARPVARGDRGSTDRVALAAMTRVAGEWGGKILTAAIVCSILGAMNALVLAGPRAYYQMAKDGLFFERVSDASTRAAARRSPRSSSRRSGLLSRPLHRRLLAALHVRHLRRLDLLRARRAGGHRAAAQGAGASRGLSAFRATRSCRSSSRAAASRSC